MFRFSVIKKAMRHISGRLATILIQQEFLTRWALGCFSCQALGCLLLERGHLMKQMLPFRYIKSSREHHTKCVGYANTQPCRISRDCDDAICQSGRNHSDSGRSGASPEVKIFCFLARLPGKERVEKGELLMTGQTLTEAMLQTHESQPRHLERPV